MSLKAISVKVPWADAIVDGHKPIENRSGGFPKGYRGILYIATSRTVSERGQTDARILLAYRGYHYPDTQRGAIIGSVLVTDIHPDTGCCRPWGESEYVNGYGGAVRDVTHLVLEDAVRLEHPVPCRGRLGIWNVPDDLSLGRG